MMVLTCLVKYDDVSNGVRILVAYAYDGDDLRIRKIVEKSTNNYTPDITNYLYDGQREMLETDSNGNVKVRYIDGLNYIARINGSASISYFMYNGHGDVTQTVSESGTIENQYDYDIFGNPTLTIEQYSCNIRYAGVSV